MIFCPFIISSGCYFNIALLRIKCRSYALHCEQWRQLY
jgi:hypothetical protein